MCRPKSSAWGSCGTLTYEDEHRLLVYEFMTRGSLEKHLFKSKHVSLLYITTVLTFN
jgi:hypothetical protein